jgi:hypothetical protein
MGRNGWNWKIDGARHQLLSLIMLNLPLIFLAPPEPHPGEKKTVQLAPSSSHLRQTAAWHHQLPELP